MSNRPNSIVKEGFIQRYKSGFLSSKWKSNYAVLHPDSTLAIYNERGDSRPAETILLRNVVPYLCVGFMTDRMPVRRPSLPPGTAVQRLVGIGMDPQASKVHWILFPSEQVLEEWIQAILTTLPPPQNPPNAAPQPMMPNSSSSNTGFVPPAKYPDAPPPYGQQQQQQPYHPPPNSAYQPQYPSAAQYGAVPPASQQTVIIDRTGADYGRGGGGSSMFGSGLAAGMGGALLGSLVGYGIGSMFAPHGGWGGGGWGGGYYGGGGGWGGGPGGFGGGYIQDNDTYVTNNYYMNNDGDTGTTPAINAPDSIDYNNHEPVQNDYTNDYYDGGGGTWDNGGGGGGDWGGGGGDWGGDGGGFDGGGGDW